MVDRFVGKIGIIEKYCYSPNLRKKLISIFNNQGDAMAAAQIKKIRSLPATDTSWIRWRWSRL